MSKPYFAKYLPVEGEIKAGDLICNLQKPFQTPWIAVIPKTYNNPHVPYWDGHTKVKLFLCSRDIQVGDTVDTSQGKAIITEVYPENKGYEIKLSNSLIALSKPDRVFKVIGEISPNATWVKEGDEFDENEIGFYWGAGEDSLGYFLIKGPCGHFH